MVKDCFNKRKLEKRNTVPVVCWLKQQGESFELEHFLRSKRRRSAYIFQVVVSWIVKKCFYDLWLNLSQSAAVLLSSLPNRESKGFMTGNVELLYDLWLINRYSNCVEIMFSYLRINVQQKRSDNDRTTSYFIIIYTILDVFKAIVMSALFSSLT
jgi:hypothetical protein